MTPKMRTFPITPAGHEKMREELQRRKAERPRISEAIGVAREEGDLSENAEYHAAKDRQGLNEARIRDLEDKLSRVEVIDPSTLSGDKVMFGATVTIEDVESGDEATYTLVGEEESEPATGRIAITSAVGRALVGKEIGDEVRVPRKGGPRLVEIVDVSYS